VISKYLSRAMQYRQSLLFQTRPLRVPRCCTDPLWYRIQFAVQGTESPAPTAQVVSALLYEPRPTAAEKVSLGEALRRLSLLKQEAVKTVVSYFQQLVDFKTGALYRCVLPGESAGAAPTFITAPWRQCHTRAARASVCQNVMELTCGHLERAFHDALLMTNAPQIDVAELSAGTRLSLSCCMHLLAQADSELLDLVQQKFKGLKRLKLVEV
jgi:hypothetical protein